MAIVRGVRIEYGVEPNIIIEDYSGGANIDCAAHGGWHDASYTAICPSIASDYRVVGICHRCAEKYIGDGRAVDRRTRIYDPATGRTTPR